LTDSSAYDSLISMHAKI